MPMTDQELAVFLAMRDAMLKMLDESRHQSMESRQHTQILIEISTALNHLSYPDPAPAPVADPPPVTKPKHARKHSAH